MSGKVCVYTTGYHNRESKKRDQRDTNKIETTHLDNADEPMQVRTGNSVAAHTMQSTKDRQQQAPRDSHANDADAEKQQEAKRKAQRKGKTVLEQSGCCQAAVKADGGQERPETEDRKQTGEMRGGCSGSVHAKTVSDNAREVRESKSELSGNTHASKEKPGKGSGVFKRRKKHGCTQERQTGMEAISILQPGRH